MTRGLLLALALVGCAAPERPPTEDPPLRSTLAHSWRIVIDPNVPSHRVDAVLGALREWQAAVPCPISFDVTIGRTGAFGSQWPAAGIIEIREDASLPQADAAGYAEHYPKAGSRVAFRTGAPDWDFPRVVRHELGHAFHIPHTPSGLMQAAPLVEHIESSDVEAFSGVWCGASL